jgi:hypothetical protein
MSKNDALALHAVQLEVPVHDRHPTVHYKQVSESKL